MFIGRTPNDPIAVRKQRQRQYKEELDRQVNARYNMQQQQQINNNNNNNRIPNGNVALAGARLADKYKQQYGFNSAAAFNAPVPQARYNGGGNNVPTAVKNLTVELEERFRYLAKAFLSADSDRSGYLDSGEIRRLCNMYNLPTNDVESVLRYVDINGNGRVNYNEFAKRLARPDYPGQNFRNGNNRNNNNNMGYNSGMDILPRGDRRNKPRNNLEGMWGGNNKYDAQLANDQRAKARKKQLWLESLNRQVQERKDRERKVKEDDIIAERRARNEAVKYDPWGRGGGGAPLRDDTGKIVTDLREVHGAAKAGGLSPKIFRAQEHNPYFQQQQQQQQLNRGQQQGGGFQETMSGTMSMRNPENGRMMTPPGGYGRLAYVAPEQAREIAEAERKREELKQTLRVQIEMKRRQKQIEKQKRAEEERREEERVERERVEILNAYQREHRDKETREKEKSAREDAEKVRQQVLQKKRGTVDDVFASTKGPPRTPPTKDELGNNKNPNTVGIGRLRRDLNKQHETLLQQLAEQRATISSLQNQLKEFYKGDVVAAVRGGGGFSSPSGGALRGSSEFIGMGNNQVVSRSPKTSPVQPSFHVNMDEPDELDALLTAFVNRKSMFSRSAKKLRM